MVCGLSSGGWGVPETTLEVAQRARLDTLFAPERQPRLRLAKTNFTVESGLTLADMVECDYVGYGPVNLADMLPAVTDGGGRARKVLNGCTFPATGPGLPQTAYGYFVSYLNDDGDPDLLDSLPFDAPVSLTEAGQAVRLNLAVYAEAVRDDLFLITTSTLVGGASTMRPLPKSFRGKDRALVRRFQRLLTQMLHMDGRRILRYNGPGITPVVFFDTTQRTLNVADFQTRCTAALDQRG